MASTAVQEETEHEETAEQEQELARGKATIVMGLPNHAGDGFLVTRFCLYAFLKNLKFFEPYLWVVLLGWGLTLTQVGLLKSVEQLTCYLFELPSGNMADRWGMKKELCLFFVWYIVSFGCYYHFGASRSRVAAAAAAAEGSRTSCGWCWRRSRTAWATRCAAARTRRWCCSTSTGAGCAAARLFCTARRDRGRC